jgi:hypothetical protein
MKAFAPQALSSRAQAISLAAVHAVERAEPRRGTAESNLDDGEHIASARKNVDLQVPDADVATDDLPAITGKPVDGGIFRTLALEAFATPWACGVSHDGV